MLIAIILITVFVAVAASIVGVTLFMRGSDNQAVTDRLNVLTSKKAVTGEGMPLMRCSGDGELFLADSGYQVHIIHLEGAGLTVNGRNVLAFEPSLSWDIERIKGAAMMAGGLFNTRLEGHGWVAITTDGDPVVLRTDQPTFADTDAAVAWSSSLTTTVNRTVKAQSIIGRGSGEAVQLAFQGNGIVIVQPSEGAAVPPHSH